MKGVGGISGAAVAFLALVALAGYMVKRRRLNARRYEITPSFDKHDAGADARATNGANGYKVVASYGGDGATFGQDITPSMMQALNSWRVPRMQNLSDPNRDNPLVTENSDDDDTEPFEIQSLVDLQNANNPQPELSRTETKNVHSLVMQLESRERNKTEWENNLAHRTPVRRTFFVI